MKAIRDEQIGQLFRRTNDVIRRVIEGTISFDSTMRVLQEIIEGKHDPKKEKVCEVFNSCRCTICGSFFADGDNICGQGHQIGVSYPERVTSV